MVGPPSVTPAGARRFEGRVVTLPRVSVVLGLWPDRPAEENLVVGRRAAELGYPELWIGEMATYDAPAVATAIGGSAPPIALTLGPLAVHVRTPTTIAMATASVGALTGRPVGVALGTSSTVVVERWHGRRREQPASTLDRAAEAVRGLLSGEKVDGFQLRIPPPTDWSLTVAAFGDRAVGVAAGRADRMVANLVSADVIADLRRKLDRAAEARERPTPSMAVWVAAAVDPVPAAYDQLRYALVAYLAAPGYGEMFERLGGGDAVAAARAGAHPRDLYSLITEQMIETIAMLGDEATIGRRLREYGDAGADEVCLVPVTAGDDGAERTLTALAP